MRNEEKKTAKLSIHTQTQIMYMDGGVVVVYVCRACLNKFIVSAQCSVIMDSSIERTRSCQRQKPQPQHWRIVGLCVNYIRHSLRPNGQWNRNIRTPEERKVNIQIYSET